MSSLQTSSINQNSGAGVSSVDSFRQSFKGYKANRFQVLGSIPSAVTEGIFFKDISFYVKAAQIPGANLGYVPLNYRGRIIKFPAERSFQDWGMQVYASSDASVDLRKLFTNWIAAINNEDHTIMNYELVAGEWHILYNDIKNATTESSPGYNDFVTIVNCFPIEISPMEFNQDVTDNFAEFTVTMAYDYAIAKP
jgi:hypothetical protein